MAAYQNQVLKVSGMICTGCEQKIERNVQKLKGIHKVDASFSKGQVKVAYDRNVVDTAEIVSVIQKLHYTVEKGGQTTEDTRGNTSYAGILLIVIALYGLMRHTGLADIFNMFPTVEDGTAYGMLFITGLLTSVHCVSMCGGINLSQCISDTAVVPAGKKVYGCLRPSFLYNLGRVLSYTLIGGIIGALGSVISLSGAGKGFIQILAGVFMVIMGLNLTGAFPGLRRLNISVPKPIARKMGKMKRGRGPLIVGLLNGFMPCGPLQAMQLYALSTGSFLGGAFSMLLFSLGTVPLMFSLGALSSVLSRKFTKRMMAAGAVLVMFLGVSMLWSGLSLSGINVGGSLASTGASASLAEAGDEIQLVETELMRGRYAPITVQAGIPVQWTIKVQEGTLTGCNYAMYIPEYNIEKQLQVGDNIIEFTPDRAGTFSYSCWMGMIRSAITVTE